MHTFKKSMKLKCQTNEADRYTYHSFKIILLRPELSLVEVKSLG